MQHAEHSTYGIPDESSVIDLVSRPSVIARKDAAQPTVPGVDLSKEEMRTVVNEGDEIEGNLTVRAGIRIKGVVRGNIRCDGGTVLVENGGHVTGSIESKGSIFVNGQVGTAGESEPRVRIASPGGVFLMDTAVVHADIEYGKLATFGDMELNGVARKANSPR